MRSILHSAVIYWVMLLAIRVVGRRSPNMMTPFEMVLIFLLGGMGMQCIAGDDRSLTNALLCISTIVLMHVIVASLKQRFPKFARVVDGTPVLIYEQGRWLEENMAFLRLQREDVVAAARQRGLKRVEQVRFAVVERTGAISIVAED